MPSVDATLLAEMLDRHGAALALYARQWTAAADDCVQEALVELSRLQTRPDNPTAWLYRVVRNRALNAVRAEQRRVAHEQSAAEARAARQPNETDPVDAVGLNDALATLTPTDREIVVLRVWGGLAWQEIAELVGGSKSGAQRAYVQALEQLRNHWEPQSC